jgi:hypothetical protein
MTKYNLPYGSQIQGMDILHKGNHHKNKNAHPNHLYVMGGMYQTPTTQTADINQLMMRHIREFSWNFRFSSNSSLKN